MLIRDLKADTYDIICAVTLIRDFLEDESMSLRHQRPLTSDDGGPDDGRRCWRFVRIHGGIRTNRHLVGSPPSALPSRRTSSALRSSGAVDSSSTARFRSTE